jgi:cytochrome c biogenesis protein CcdA
MVQFFSHLIPITGKFSLYVFKGFGLLAIILGLLNIKDYLDYKPGSFATEMPLSLRPRMRNLVKKITSVKGAFIIGLFVTIFLVPCTMGPYLIASAKLSGLTFLSTIPYLFLYNLIFILPMLALTLIIYLGVSTIENLSSWRERNIKKMHLAEGIILILLGIAMVTGLI